MSIAPLYTISTRQVTIDGDVMFEARVREMPDIVVYGEDSAEAYLGAIETIDSAVHMLTQEGIPVPTVHPMNDEYSGRVTLRLPKSLHRCLDEASEVDGVSLNQHIVNVLTYHAAYGHAQGAASATWKRVRVASREVHRPSPTSREVHRPSLTGREVHRPSPRRPQVQENQWQDLRLVK